MEFRFSVNESQIFEYHYFTFVTTFGTKTYVQLAQNY